MLSWAAKIQDKFLQLETKYRANPTLQVIVFVSRVLPAPTGHTNYVGVENEGYDTGHTTLHTTIGHIPVTG